MKKLLVLVLSIFLMSNLKAQNEVGVLKNNIPEITADKSSLMQKLEKDANANLKIDIKILELNIVKVSDGGYNLKANSEDYKISVLLYLEDNKFYFTTKNFLKTTTCTTKACSSSTGCEVTMGGYCTKCKGDCTRTQSSYIE